MVSINYSCEELISDIHVLSAFRGTIEKRWGDYLVDKSEYNRVISSMSIDKCPYMKNFKTGGRNFEN